MAGLGVFLILFGGFVLGYVRLNEWAEAQHSKGPVRDGIADGVVTSRRRGLLALAPVLRPLSVVGVVVGVVLVLIRLL